MTQVLEQVRTQPVEIITGPSALPSQGEIFGLGKPNLAENFFSQAGIPVNPPPERTLMSVALPGMKEGLTIEGNLTTNTRGNLVLTSEGRRKAAELTETILKTTGCDFSLARQQLVGLREERMRIKAELRENEMRVGRPIDAAYRQTPDYQAEVLLQRVLSSVDCRLKNAARRNQVPVAGVAVETAGLGDQAQLEVARTVIAQEASAADRTVLQPEAAPRSLGLRARLAEATNRAVEGVRSLFQRKENPAEVVEIRTERQETMLAETIQPALQPETRRSIVSRLRTAAGRIGTTVLKTADKLAVPALAVASTSATVALAANLDGYAPFFHQPGLTPLMVNLIVHGGMLTVLGLHTLLSADNLRKALWLLPRKVANYIAAVAGTSLASSLMGI